MSLTYYFLNESNFFWCRSIDAEQIDLTEKKKKKKFYGPLPWQLPPQFSPSLVSSPARSAQQPRCSHQNIQGCKYRLGPPPFLLSLLSSDQVPSLLAVSSVPCCAALWEQRLLEHTCGGALSSVPAAERPGPQTEQGSATPHLPPTIPPRPAYVRSEEDWCQDRLKIKGSAMEAALC